LYGTNGERTDAQGTDAQGGRTDAQLTQNHGRTFAHAREECVIVFLIDSFEDIRLLLAYFSFGES
jgi:hypothetical protein